VIPTVMMITGMATLVMMTVTGLDNICVTKKKGASAPFFYVFFLNSVEDKFSNS
jgi:hypothetical protein